LVRERVENSVLSISLYHSPGLDHANISLKNTSHVIV
jgi:hypothetical protein